MRLSDNDGFTLIELMIALVISGIISIAMYSAYTSQQRVNQAQDHVVAIQQDLRAGLDMMARELRMAGYDPDKKWGAGFTVASATTVQFTLVADDDGVDNDGDKVKDEAGELKTIQFSNQLANGDDDDNDGQVDEPGEDAFYDGYGDGGPDLGRLVGSDFSYRRVLIENVEHLEFYYTLVGDPNPTTTPTQADITGNKIRSIQISVLVRASEKSVGYLDAESYQSASGADWTPPPDDTRHFRRRMQVITVDCRNMGW